MKLDTHYCKDRIKSDIELKNMIKITKFYISKDKELK